MHDRIPQASSVSLKCGYIGVERHRTSHGIMHSLIETISNGMIDDINSLNHVLGRCSCERGERGWDVQTQETVKTTRLGKRHRSKRVWRKVQFPVLRVRLPIYR